MDPRDEELAMEAFPQLPKRVTIALWKGNLKSWREVHSRTDAELMDLEGIGTESVELIREACPIG